MAAKVYDDPKIHLTILGRERAFDARVRLGACKSIDVLPLARQVTDYIMAVAAEAAEAEGREVRCKAGCAACCRHLVPIAPIEALAIAKRVKALPGNRREAVRRRFSAAVRRLEEVGLLDRGALPGRTQLTADPTRSMSAWEVASTRYFEARIACPLLEDERCIVYEDRPSACRQHAVTTPPSQCDGLDGGADIVAKPVRMSEILAELSAALGDVDEAAMPLVLALEWSEACGVELEGEEDGEQLARDLLARVAAALTEAG